jgi:hypothetical protein
LFYGYHGNLVMWDDMDLCDTKACTNMTIGQSELTV